MANRKTLGCGSCSFESRNPKLLSPTTPVIRLGVGFEGALRLKAAIDECVMRLNQYNRSSSAGRQSKLELVIYLNKKRIQIVGARP